MSTVDLKINCISNSFGAHVIPVWRVKKIILIIEDPHKNMTIEVFTFISVVKADHSVSVGFNMFWNHSIAIQVFSVGRIKDAVRYAHGKGKLIFAAGGTSTSFTNFVGVIFSLWFIQRWCWELPATKSKSNLLKLGNFTAFHTTTIDKSTFWKLHLFVWSFVLKNTIIIAIHGYFPKILRQHCNNIFYMFVYKIIKFYLYAFSNYLCVT